MYLSRKRRKNKIDSWLIGLIIAIVITFILILICLLFLPRIFNNPQQANHTSTSDLISTNEIATLSVSEFVYNGIARTYKENGDTDWTETLLSVAGGVFKFVLASLLMMSFISLFDMSDMEKITESGI